MCVFELLFFIVYDMVTSWAVVISWKCRNCFKAIYCFYYTFGHRLHLGGGGGVFGLSGQFGQICLVWIWTHNLWVTDPLSWRSDTTSLNWTSSENLWAHAVALGSGEKPNVLFSCCSSSTHHHVHHALWDAFQLTMFHNSYFSYTRIVDAADVALVELSEFSFWEHILKISDNFISLKSKVHFVRKCHVVCSALE